MTSGLAKGSGAPIGNHNAWKHGARSTETVVATSYVMALIQLLGEMECE